MKNSPREVVDKMLVAFKVKDIEAIAETVSEDTLWIYHGTHVIPKGEMRGKEGVSKFFESIITRTEMLHFEAEKYIEQNNMVIIIGNEHQRVKRSGKELKQKWVQIYTVDNGLITRMEEFASTEVVKE